MGAHRLCSRRGPNPLRVKRRACTLTGIVTTSHESPSAEPFDRYLSLLNVVPRPPSYEALRELVDAHLCRVPFENVSKVHRMQTEGLRGLPRLVAYLDGIDRYGFGGTCYLNGYFVHLLLAHLGYDVDLCGADMSESDVHLVNVVRVGGREFLVDVGYAAPFHEPIPLDLDEEYSVELGRDRYAFMPRSADGWVSQVHCRNGEQVHEYHVNPTPRTIDHFEAVVLDSYRPEGEFVTQLRYVAFQRQSLIAVRNLRLIEVNAKGTHVTRLEKWQLPALMFERFGIPADITDAVVATMSLDGPAAYP